MAHRIIHTMSDFYNRAGAFLRSEVIEHGAFPSKVHTAIFHYENGEARFDGKRWAWCVGEGA